jgi:glutamate 5-kinase
LSDIDGLYTADPHLNPDAKLIQWANAVDDHVLSLAGASNSNLGTGGMITKLEAARICLSCGCDMIITNGNNPANIYDVIIGKAVGTTFTEKAHG